MRAFLFKYKDSTGQTDFMLVQSNTYEQALQGLHKVISQTVMNHTVENRTMAHYEDGEVMFYSKTKNRQ